ncbi:hypothetical protein [Escherichia phage phiWec190]|nr:hypothetical protein [Escherichia phage phiWec188]BDU13847.1 hypothetical protein [Escherichia phage phiWec190]
MFTNKAGKTEFLRGLQVGKPEIWHCSKSAHNEMKDFTASLQRVKITITQKKALIVAENEIPQTIIIIERTS